MKKSVCCLSLLSLALTLVSCGNLTSSTSDSNVNNNTSNTTNSDVSSSFTNPGDYLGGGSSIEVPDIDDEIGDEVKDEIDNAITTKDDSAVDLLVSYDASATTITLSDNNSSFTGTGVSISGNVITITALGTYVLSGTLTNGRVLVNDVEGNVHIVLNGVNITSSDSAPLAIFGKKKKVVTVAAGTTNTLTDASTYTVFNNTDNDEPNGTLFAKKSLTINGTGKLIVNGNYNNGISCKSDLKILDADVEVNAINNAVKGNDSITVKGATMKVTSQADGFKSDNETDEGCGTIYFEDSKIEVNAQEDGIQAYRYLHVKSGEFNIVTGGGASNNTSSSNNDDWWGSSSSSSSEETSRKGIKCDMSLLVEGGTFTLDCYDDAIHCNDSTIISDGYFTIKSGDDAIHSDELVHINGGTIDITKCYEGIEAAKITINGGNISLIASDDGINAADGTTNAMGNSNSNCYMTINGGNIYVNATGDGVDSNGTIVMNGGYLYIDGPTSSGNGSLDSDGGFVMNGGVLFAVGALGMVETPVSNSSQYVVNYASSTSLSANTKMTVKDSSGNDLVTFTPLKSFRSIIISIPDFERSQTYSLYGDSTLLTSFTISSTITTVGSQTNPGMGGGGQGGRPW